MRTDNFKSFVLKVQIPDNNNNDTCFFNEVDNFDPTITADLYPCQPEVVRFQNLRIVFITLIFFLKSLHFFLDIKTFCIELFLGIQIRLTIYLFRF